METGLTVDQIKIGDKVSGAKTIGESDVYMFAGITGDFNPMHINAEYVKGTRFNRRIAHGMLSAGLISAVLGTKLPGPGSIYLRQELSFKAPVYIADTITAEAEVIDMVKEKNLVRLKTICYNQEGVVVVEGEALVMPRKGGM